MLFTELSRRESCALAEIGGKVSVAAEADFFGDDGKGKVGVDQDLSGMTDPHIQNILVDGAAGMSCEQTVQVVFMIAGEPREQSIGHRFVVMGVDMVNDLLNRACTLGYALHAAPQQLHKQRFQKRTGSFPVKDPPGGKFVQYSLK